MNLVSTQPPGVAGLADLAEFERALTGRRSRWGDLSGHFQRRRTLFVARAPGRLDCMGGIADYSGSLVCEVPLAEAALAAVQRRTDDRVMVHSVVAERSGLRGTVATTLAELTPRAKDYEAVRKRLTADPTASWAAYVLGIFPVLLAENVIPRFDTGATVVVAGDVPLGAGVSSSAALEVASLFAVCGAYGLHVEGVEAARLGQVVENRVVGAPCGIMDQLTATLGNAGEFLIIRCQPYEVVASLPLPPGWKLFGINSNVKHSVGGDKYINVRTAAFMGHRIITTLVEQERPTSFEYRPLGRYLCNLSPREFNKLYRRRLPPRMIGAKFLETYGDTADPLTSPAPHKTYAIRSRTEHPVYENARVEQFVEDLAISYRTRSLDFARDAGELMYASHWSYSNRCGLSSPETDLLVDLVKRRDGNLLGAKITGGGSGGTVAVLGVDDCEADLHWVLDEYTRLTGSTPDVFTGSSPGALQFGCARYVLR